MTTRLLFLILGYSFCWMSLTADTDLVNSPQGRVLFEIQNQTDLPLIAVYLIAKGQEYTSYNLLTTSIAPYAVAFVFAQEGDFIVRAVYSEEEDTGIYLEKAASFKVGRAYLMVIDKQVESAFLMPDTTPEEGSEYYNSEEEYYEEDYYYEEDDEYYNEDY